MMTMKAPVGPVTENLVPPSSEARNPAMTAVKMPACGVTPLAMANAIASGSATIPTVNPARTSCRNTSW
jgi:hypothetical protein